ncbi:MAG: hypothetical protein AAFY11_16115 [Cyanobacteria bacterium J06641_5]
MQRLIRLQWQQPVAIAVIALGLLIQGSRVQSQEGPQRAPYTPFTLVNAAYDGRLESEGIPSFGDLVADVLQHDIEAEDLVRAGIARGRLTEETLADRRYLRAVQAGLDSLVDADSFGD